MKGIGIEREWKGDRETGQNIANKIEYKYYSFSITKLQKPKETLSKIKILYK